MDSFELNKIIGAVLGTLLFVMGVVRSRAGGCVRIYQMPNTEGDPDALHDRPTQHDLTRPPTVARCS